MDVKITHAISRESFLKALSEEKLFFTLTDFTLMLIILVR